MAETFDVKAHLTVEDLRELNLSQWKLGPARNADQGEYTARELSNPQHPYRRLFEGYSQRLLVVSVAEAHGVAVFGEGAGS